MSFDARTMGTIALITSPLMLLEALLLTTDHLPGGELGRGDAIIGLIYLCGFGATLIGLNQTGVTGRYRTAQNGQQGTLCARSWVQILFVAQMSLLLLAAVQQSLELAQANTLSGLFGLADLAWPLSHLLMCAAGMAILTARCWTGYRACLPFLCGLAVPVLVALQQMVGKETGRIAFGLLTTIGFGMLGYALRSSSQHMLVGNRPTRP